MKIGRKISVMGIGLVLVSALAIVGIVLQQKRDLRTRLEAIIHRLALEESSITVSSLYRTCLAVHTQVQRRLEVGFGAARAELERAGGARLDAQTADWSATNQTTGEFRSVSLPRLMLGSEWTGQIVATNTPAPVLDKIERLSGARVTLFQRMNEEGDMLRVCTTVVTTNNTRAIGTFIPRLERDGAQNPVVSTVLAGETFRGRAWVVDRWHVAQYAPLWDERHERVIGMLYLGTPVSIVTEDLRQAVLATRVGKTGYAFVIGTQGPIKGKYIVSYKGTRDGDDIWDTRDADGRYPIQSMIAKALNTSEGVPATERYLWQNKGEAKPRAKYAAITQFAPYDWMLGVTTYEDDYNDYIDQVDQVLRKLLLWVALVAGLVGVVAIVVSQVIGRGISAPIAASVGTLDRISQGDLSQEVSEALLKRPDEAGDLARAMQTTTHGLRALLREIAGGIQTLATSSTELTGVSANTSREVKAAVDKATTVAAAAEESSSNTASVAGSMDRASANLASVAAATEEMSATVADIASNSEKARAISEHAVGEAQTISTLVQQLGDAAQQIGQVTETITDISSQTNLLALNATIEAARAGAAGKGFAVVANEIKELARQTAAATEDIKAKIAGVQASAGRAIGDIEKITGVIQEVGGIVANIAAAIEEQAAVTKDVANNVAQASAGVKDANHQVAETAAVSGSIAQDIAAVNRAVADLRQDGERVQASATELSVLADQLQNATQRFRFDTGEDSQA